MILLLLVKLKEMVSTDSLIDQDQQNWMRCVLYPQVTTHGNEKKQKTMNRITMEVLEVTVKTNG